MFCICASFVIAPAQDGIISHWNFDGNANDLIGSNHGTVTGANLASGVSGQAYNFNGGEIHNINVGNDISLKPTDQFTISTWVSPDDYADAWGGAGFIIADGRDCCGFTGGLGLHLMTDQKPRGYIWGTDGNQYEIKGNPLITEEWNHIVFTFNGVDLSIYQNGISTSKRTINQNSVSRNSASMEIGRHVYGGANSHFVFHGKIDEIKMWSRALSDVEIKEVYGRSSSEEIIQETKNWIKEISTLTNVVEIIRIYEG